MKKVYSFKEKRRLPVGEVLDFLIIKVVVLPDEKEYWVVEDPFGDRHLVPTYYYNKYKIQIGSKYPFHVDKVNCKGQVFLEPLHPFYKVGNYYEFAFLKTIEERKKSGKKRCFYLMKGKNNDFAYLEKKRNFVPPKNTWINYKIVKIKKSKVYIS